MKGENSLCLVVVRNKLTRQIKAITERLPYNFLFTLSCPCLKQVYVWDEATMSLQTLAAMQAFEWRFVSSKEAVEASKRRIWLFQEYRPEQLSRRVTSTMQKGAPFCGETQT